MTNPEPRLRPDRRSPGPEGLPLDLDRNRSREEITLAEFPVTTMAQKRPKVTELQVDELIGHDDLGAPIHRTWTIVGSERYGLPLAGDEDIYVAIVKLLEHHRFTERVLACTRYQICQLLDVQPDGRVYQRISDALTRLASTKFVAENVFRDPKTDVLIKREAFGMIDAFRFVDRAPRRSEHLQQELPLSYIRVADEFLRRLRDGKLKRLDLEFWRSLSTHLTRRLYRYLDKNRYRKEEYEIGVVKLGLRLGLAGSNPPKELKRLLGRPIDELTQRGFLAGHRFAVSPQVGSKVLFRFSPDRRPATPRAPRTAPDHIDATNAAAEGRITRNSAPPEPPSDEIDQLARYFSEIFHGVTKDALTAAERSTARTLLHRCAGDVEDAHEAIRLAYKHTRDWNPPASNFAAVLTNDFPERATASRKEREEREARAEEERREHEAVQAARQELDAEARRLFQELPDEEREQLVAVQTANLAKIYPRYREWTAERVREWALAQAAHDFRETRMPTLQEWLRGLRAKPGATSSEPSEASDPTTTSA